MLSCKKVSELIDKKSVVKLSEKENVMMQMNAAICDSCKAYQKQSRILDVLLKQQLQKADEIQI